MGISMDLRWTLMPQCSIIRVFRYKDNSFAPQYETEQQVNSRVPDFRTLLYWTPDIKTDAQGKGKLSFYTSDLPGKYAVVVQGITDEGESGSRVIYFSVKK